MPEINKVKILQLGGEVTANSPLDYKGTAAGQADLSKFGVIDFTQQTPVLDTKDLGELKGFTSDVAEKVAQYNALQNKLSTMPKFLLSTEGQSVIRQMKDIYSALSINQLANDKDQGDYARASLKENKSANTWLTNSDGKVGVLVGDKKGKHQVKFVEVVEGAALVNNGLATKITGATAYDTRNNHVSYKDPEANELINSMNSTFGIEHIMDRINKYKTDAKNSKSWEASVFKRLDTDNKVNRQAILSHLYGSKTTGGGSSNNSAQYARAIKGAWNELGRSMQATLKTEIAANLDRVSNTLLKEANVSRTELESMSKSTDPTTLAKFDQILSLAAQEQTANVLLRHIGTSTSSKSTFSINAGLSKRSGGGDEQDSAPISNTELALIGASDRKVIQVAEQGKDKPLITIAGFHVPAVDITNDDGTGELLQKSKLLQNSTGVIYTASGNRLSTPATNDLKASAVVDPSETVIVNMPVLSNGDPVIKYATNDQQAKEINELVSSLGNNFDVQEFNQILTEKYPNVPKVTKMTPMYVSHLILVDDKVDVIPGLEAEKEKYMQKFDADRGYAEVYNAAKSRHNSSFEVDDEGITFSGIDNDGYRIPFYTPVASAATVRNNQKEAFFKVKTGAGIEQAELIGGSLTTPVRTSTTKLSGLSDLDQ